MHRAVGSTSNERVLFLSDSAVSILGRPLEIPCTHTNSDGRDNIKLGYTNNVFLMTLVRT